MRLIIIITILTVTSCNSQNKSTDDEKSIYNSWKKSFINSVTKESSLLNYQKENLLDLLKSISPDDFVKLKQSFIDKNIKIDDEYYLLELSEGEVVTAYLYYIISSGKEYQLTVIDIYDKNKIITLEMTSSDVVNLIDVKPINSESLNDNILVLTKIENNILSTIIGSEYYSN